MTDLPALSFDHAAWMQRGACRGNGPDTFFPTGRADAAVAKLICADCPVKTECLNYAMRNGDIVGIWGGTSEKQRRQLRVIARADNGQPAMGKSTVRAHGTVTMYRRKCRCELCVAAFRQDSRRRMALYRERHPDKAKAQRHGTRRDYAAEKAAARDALTETPQTMFGLRLITTIMEATG